ncbi:MAG: hypothetical protein ACYDB0_05600 [Acidithiobacillus sp.]
MGELYVLKPEDHQEPVENVHGTSEADKEPIPEQGSITTTASTGYSMGLTMIGALFLGFMVADGFWVFWKPIPTSRVSWVILCLAMAAGMLFNLRKERFFSSECKTITLFTSNRRCNQILTTLLFLSVFCGVMSWAGGAFGATSQIYGFNSVMFLTASLIFYAHIDVQAPATF